MNVSVGRIQKEIAVVRVILGMNGPDRSAEEAVWGAEVFGDG